MHITCIYNICFICVCIGKIPVYVFLLGSGSCPQPRISFGNAAGDSVEPRLLRLGQLGRTRAWAQGLLWPPAKSLAGRIIGFFVLFFSLVPVVSLCQLLCMWPGWVCAWTDREGDLAPVCTPVSRWERGQRGSMAPHAPGWLPQVLG